MCENVFVGVCFTRDRYGPQTIFVEGIPGIVYCDRGSYKSGIMLDLYHYFSAPKKSEESRHRKKNLYRGLLFLGVEMAVGLKSGMKENLIFPVIMAVVAYVKARKKNTGSVPSGRGIIIYQCPDPFYGGVPPTSMVRRQEFF